MSSTFFYAFIPLVLLHLIIYIFGYGKPMMEDRGEYALYMIGNFLILLFCMWIWG